MIAADRPYVFLLDDAKESIVLRMSYRQMEECRESGLRYRLPDGRHATRLLNEEVARFGQVRESARQSGRSSVSAYRENKPHVSLGAAIHPMQVREFNEAAVAAGASRGPYRPDGRPEFGSKGEERREYSRRNIFNQDGGYSDAMPQNR